MSHQIFKQTNLGFEVYPSPKVKLPGFYMDRLRAERAYDKYRNAIQEVKANRRKDK